MEGRDEPLLIGGHDWSVKNIMRSVKVPSGIKTAQNFTITSRSLLKHGGGDGMGCFAAATCRNVLVITREPNHQHLNGFKEMSQGFGRAWKSDQCVRFSSIYW